jgi:ankyrin repeat protein
MKSLSCMSSQRDSVQLPPTLRLDNSIDTHKDDTKITTLGQKGPKMHTLIEVLRCELAKPGRAASNTRLTPSKQWTPIYYAVFHNRESALLHFLRAGQSPDDVTGTGQPPICIAVEAGHIEAARILCEAGADTKATTSDNGETALHIAIKTGRTDLTDLLLKYATDLVAQTASTGETPLHYAAAKPGCLATVVTLLKRGAKYDVLNVRGRSPAEIALEANNIHAAVAIINAARGKRSKLAKEKEMLLKHVEKTQNRFSMNNELISDIFSASCDPDSTVLVEAIKKDDASLVEMFLGKDADPNRPTATGLLPIFAALNCSGAAIVHSLIKHGVDVTVCDSEGLTVFQAALDSPLAHEKEAMTGICDALLSGGADSKTTYPDGKTLLHHAVSPSLGLARVAQRLLEYGLDVNKTDNLGNTPLHLATSRSCIEILLKNGAGATLLDNQELTPLLSIVTSATKDTEPDLESLIKASDLRALDQSGKTALHLAAQNGLERTVRSLLKHRAETTVLDARKKTALLLAVHNQQWNVVPLLATQPGINTWDEAGSTALHHTATSIPHPPATWKDIAFAIGKFCEKGVSRSMRDKSGATPLIQAVKTLPEEGISVIEALLSGLGRANCVEHEDHKQRSALYFAATLSKPVFVQMLLKNGATFALKEWTVTKGPLKSTTAANRQTLKLLAEHEWLRRMILLRRQSGGVPDKETVAVLPKILPVSVLTDLLAMGLDPSSLPVPRSQSRGLLLWAILNNMATQSLVVPQYLYDIIKLTLSTSADASVPTKKPSTPDSKERLTMYPIAFLLEQHPKVDIDLTILFLEHGASLATASPFYNGSYPLHSAVRSNRLDLVDEFLIRKADPNATDSQHRTPIFLAAENGFWEIAEMLLKHGAKVDLHDADGNTPLHRAAVGGSTRIVLALQRKGAKAGVRNKNDLTPLSCISEGLAEKDKNKITAMLKNAEELEERNEVRNQPSKKLTTPEKKPDLSTASSSAYSKVSKTSLTPPHISIAPITPIAMNRLSASSIVQAPKTATRMQMSPRTASVIYTPPSPKPTQTSFPKTATGSPELPSSSTLSIEKPLPRIDSGVRYTKTSEEEKASSALDRSKKMCGDEMGARDSKEDFKGWLAMSQLLEQR